MNEHDESEIAAPIISVRDTATSEVVAKRFSCLEKARSVSQTNDATCRVNLPAALAMTSFLPHAREIGRNEPQRRRLSTGSLFWRTHRNPLRRTDYNFHTFYNSGSMGHLDHPTCCLHISGPIRPRQNFYKVTFSIYERGRTIRTEGGRQAFRKR